MGGEFEKQEGLRHHFSGLLEIQDFGDLIDFKSVVEEEGHDVDEESMWYGSRIGSKMRDLQSGQLSSKGISFSIVTSVLNLLVSSCFGVAL